ncbi:MAG: prepilin-type N-terminal cleavage/methylation domain-containing protein [Phycisphaerales bacterium]|nr:prepilin-type N-terminal cleavage/methylation domain-containing protein [Phycisphaerales bacterium]
MVALLRKANASAKQPSQSLSQVRRGFTLMEVMTVVVILGILIALISFSVMWMIKAAERAAFAANLRGFANAAHMYRTEYGYYPPDAEPGELPPGMEKFLDADEWASSRPFGGHWDITSGGGPHGTQFGIGVAMADGIVDEEGDVVREQAYASLTSLDDEIDDGNLNTGNFRRIGEGRFYLVIAE